MVRDEEPRAGEPARDMGDGPDLGDVDDLRAGAPETARQLPDGDEGRLAQELRRVRLYLDGAAHELGEGSKSGDVGMEEHRVHPRSRSPSTSECT